MTNSLLSIAESHVFSRSATYTMMPELQHLKFESIQLVDADVYIKTIEGDIVLPRDVYVHHFIEHHRQVPNFFDYVSPKYQSRIPWLYGFFFLPIGWIGQTRHPDQSMLLRQTAAISQLKCTSDFQALVRYACCPTQLFGHFVAHQGLTSLPVGLQVDPSQPYCTCGTYQLQLRYLDQFKQVCGDDFQPHCKHIAHMHALDEPRGRLSELIYKQSLENKYKSLAYWYLPPESNEDQGELKALYIDARPMRSIEHWTRYESREVITRDKVWLFFHKAIDNGYAIKLADALPNLHSFLRMQKRKGSLA